MTGREAVGNWLGRLSENSRDKEELVLNLFLRWASLNGGEFSTYTPDEFVEFQKNAITSGDRYKVLDLLQKYTSNLSGLRFKTKQKYYGTVRSFFEHNRAALPQDRSFRIRGDVEAVRGTLTIDEFRRALLGSKPRYRAILLSMFQGGLDSSSFMYWNVNGKASLMEQLKGDPEAVKIHLPGRKKSRNEEGFYTFIGKDSIDAIRQYHIFREKEENRKREKAKKKGETYSPDPNAIFVDQFGGPIQYNGLRMYWSRLLRRLGLIEPKGSYSGNRYGKNLHELRDLFRSRWRLTGIDVELAEYFLGHGLDRYGYDKSPQHDPEWFKDKYVEASSWLNILTEDPQKVSVKEVHSLRMENRRLEEELKMAQNVQNQKIADMEEQLRLIQEYMRKKG